MLRAFRLTLLYAALWLAPAPSFAQSSVGDERRADSVPPAAGEASAQTEGSSEQNGPSFTDASGDDLMAACAGAADDETTIRCNDAIDSGKLNAYQFSEAQYRIAIAELFLRHFDATVERASLSIGANPEWPAPYLLRGTANRERQNYSEAMQDYDYVIALERREIIADAYTERATAHAKMGNLQLALADLDEALRRNPHHKRAQRNRTSVLEQMGR
jgi:tetratricopeptide (TPR) repeat protein